MKSWKTTVSGIAAILISVSTAVKAEFDGDPATIADWGSVVAACIVGIGLIAARDNGVSSEAAGAK